jgi:hypothetical protein
MLLFDEGIGLQQSSRADFRGVAMTSQGRYVCAFRGRRDNYQVPLALQQANRLEAFITDAYASARVARLADCLPRRLAKKIQSRRETGLPDDRIHCLWATTAREHFRNLFGKSPSVTYALLDRRYSQVAADYASKAKANLFVYSPYAWEAFSARYPHDPRKM